MSIIDSRVTRKPARTALLVFVLLAGGCAGVPYQAMSDARQAVDSASAVVTGESGGGTILDRARDVLDDAEGQLRAGNYSDARRHAERAKKLAIEARRQARPDP